MFSFSRETYISIPRLSVAISSSSDVHCKTDNGSDVSWGIQLIGSSLSLWSCLKNNLLFLLVCDQTLDTVMSPAISSLFPRLVISPLFKYHCLFSDERAEQCPHMTSGF